MNSLNIISPYKYLDMWVFDDPKVGLIQEPFVNGADSMIDQVVKSIPNSENGFILLFSSNPFPGQELHLEWLRAEKGGNWYFSKALKMEGWLCPALFKYFSDAPTNLYIQIKAKK